jgi:hypothetical protein
MPIRQGVHRFSGQALGSEYRTSQQFQIQCGYRMVSSHLETEVHKMAVAHYHQENDHGRYMDVL